MASQSESQVSGEYGTNWGWRSMRQMPYSLSGVAESLKILLDKVWVVLYNE